MADTAISIHDRVHPCNAGCKYQCLTCCNWLRGEFEVWSHWRYTQAWHGHSIFVDRNGVCYHQTTEGLHKREHWDADKLRQGARTST
jgi:hypothetical protein